MAQYSFANIAAQQKVSPLMTNDGVVKAELTDEQMDMIVGSAGSRVSQYSCGTLRAGESSQVFSVSECDSFTIQYSAENVPTMAEMHVLGSMDNSNHYGIMGTRITQNGCVAVTGEFGKAGVPDANYLSVIFAHEVGGIGCKVGVELMLRRYGHPKIQIEDILRWFAERKLKGEA